MFASCAVFVHGPSLHLANKLSSVTAVVKETLNPVIERTGVMDVLATIEHTLVKL